MSALFVAWRGADPQNGAWGPVGRLEHDGGVYRYWYTQGAQKAAGFRPFPQMEDMDRVYESDDLFPLFANRLLSSSRTEYDPFLRWGGFDPNNPPDPIAILGVTEGIRQTDSVEVFPCPIPDLEGCYVNKFFLHGVRWMSPAAIARISELQDHEQLFVEPESTNPFDRNAVAVFTADRMRIGYVPRYLAHDVGNLLDNCHPSFIKLFVARLNNDAPMQQRVLCQMHSCWPAGFVPCSSDAFQPIPNGVPTRCEA